MTAAAVSSTKATLGCLAIWLLPLLLLAAQQSSTECRYLPTRSHGDDLDKLRELMLQILESSNEEPLRPPNEANGNTLTSNAAWLNKIGALDLPRKYAASMAATNSAGRPGLVYDQGRYY